MNEFNPFDDLGIQVWSNEDYQESWRDRNYKNLYNPFDDKNISTNVTPEYEPDFQESATTPINLQDFQAQQELGTELPQPMSDAEKQAYVDALSADDWKTWKKLKQEWYSFEWRQMLFENRDNLYDITEEGNDKFWSWRKNRLHEQLIESAQWASDFQTDYIHPWLETAEDRSQMMANDLGSYSYDEILQELKDKRIDENDDALVRWMKTQASNSDARIKREAALIGSTFFNALGSLADGIDRLTSSIVQLEGVTVNALNTWKKWYDMVTWDSSKDPSTILWNYWKIIYDSIWPWFLMKHPFASYILLSAADKIPLVDKVMNGIIETPTAFMEGVLEDTKLEAYLKKYMTEEEYDSIFQDVTTWLLALLVPKTKKLGIKITNTKMYQLANAAWKTVSKMMKRAFGETIGKANETVQQIGTEPVWTTYDVKWKPWFESTENGWRMTKRWAYNVLKEAIGNSLHAGKRWVQWIWENRNRHLVTRDPNAPVGELPYVNPEWVNSQWTPTPEEPIQVEKEVTKTEQPKWKTVKTTPIKIPSVETTSLAEFIKKVSNDLSGKKGWLNSDLITKLQTDVDLQNEYVNTIDPYIKSTQWENPAWVIQQPLEELVQTIKDRLNYRNDLNRDFRKGQQKAKVQIPESDKAQWKKDDIEIKGLIKLLNKSFDNPEKFLKYLSNLPKEKVDLIHKYYPDFSKNLGTIKDILSITKAITAPWLIGKYLKIKSTWGTRNKNFIRKWIYKKLEQKYREAWISYNMRQIENMINQLPESKLRQLEQAILDDGDLPAFAEKDMLDQIVWYNERENIKNILNKPVDQRTPEENKAIRDNLIKQWYEDFEGDDMLPSFNNEMEMRNYQLHNWTTIWDILDENNISLKSSTLKPGRIAQANLPAGELEYTNTPNQFKRITPRAIAHEIVHFWEWGLTTAELLDLYEWLAKSTKDLKLTKKSLSPSDYPSIAKSELSISEYLEEITSAYLTHWDIRWLASYIDKSVSGRLRTKAKKILEKVGKNLWDTFSTVKVNWKEFQPAQEIKKFVDKAMTDESMKKWEKNYLDPNYAWGKWYSNRLSQWNEIDPEIQWYDWNYDNTSPDFWRLSIKKGDQNLTWEEYKNQYPELANKMYNKTSVPGDIQQFDGYGEKPAFWRDTENPLNKYKDVVREIDPDVVWLIEQNGKLYVQYMIDSNVERWELPDRPWFVELKKVPAKDFFSEEEIKKLPKDLQDLINKDGD